MWAEKLQSAREILASAGWMVRDESRYGNREILLAAEVSLPELVAQFERLLAGLQKGVSQVRIE
jgi:hypothetical protein